MSATIETLTLDQMCAHLELHGWRPVTLGSNAATRLVNKSVGANVFFASDYGGVKANYVSAWAPGDTPWEETGWEGFDSSWLMAAYVAIEGRPRS